MKIGPLSIKLERRSTLANPQQWLVDWFSGGKAASGATVNETTALNATTVFSAVDILSRTLASLPLPVYHRLPGGGKERASDHGLYELLHDQANPLMTSFEFRQALMGHLALRGNAYAEIERDENGQVVALWPLRPEHMAVEGSIRSPRYIYHLPDGSRAMLSQDRIMHIRGLSTEGLIGYSPIRMAREAIGLALATQEYGARFFGNGSRPGGVLQHPGKLTKEGADRLRTSWEEMHRGLSESHRVAILEEGMAWQQIGIPPEDAQFLETRKFQVAEIARVFHVPPHMLADLDRSTFSNIEHQGIEFVVHTMRPWLVCWEQAIRRDLFAPGERRTYFAEFLVDGLLRGDIQSRYQAYAVGRQNGWLSADDIRDLENMNPLPDGQGKVYLVPLNMVPADAVGQVPQPQTSQGQRGWLPDEERARRSAGSRRQLAKSFERLFRDAELYLLRREEKTVMGLARKWLNRRDAAQFNTDLEQFYRDHQELMQAKWLPIYLTYADAAQAEAAKEINAAAGMTPQLEEFIRAYLVSHVALHAGSALGQLQQVARKALEAGEDEIKAVQARFDEWKEKRPGKIALAETVQAANAVAREVYRANGIQRVRWMSFNPSCPYCRHLNGKMAQIDSTFIPASTDFQPEGADRPLKTSADVRHPPGHEGCDCQLMAST